MRWRLAPVRRVGKHRSRVPGRRAVRHLFATSQGDRSGRAGRARDSASLGLKMLETRGAIRSPTRARRQRWEAAAPTERSDATLRAAGSRPAVGGQRSPQDTD